MADARKRSRRSAAASGAVAGPEPEGGARPGKPEQATFPAPAEAATPAEPPAADLVFSDEPETAGSATTAAGAAKVALPASGLAEDILRQLGDAPAAAAAAPALKASGLAEEVVGREHTLSFFSAPAQAQRAAAEATEHLATFYLAREEYGVDVKQVQEIRRVAEITAVPRAPEFVRGVINLRGRILPVLDLRRRLGLGEVQIERASRIVVVRLKERLLGLLVDGASQVLKVPLSRIEAAPEEVVQKGGDYIRGVAKLDDRLIILVDLERLLASELAAPGGSAAATGSVAAEDAISQE